MATYFKYAEREADSYINWAEIGKSMSDMLSTEFRIREQKREAIDKASREYGEQLATPPQGEHKGMNQWSLEYAAEAQQFRLMQDKLLKSGRLKLKDYVVGRQNIIDGTNQAFNLMEEYNTEYSAKMERTKAEQNQDLESWLMGEAEGFANFSDTKLYIDPTTGSVSVAKMVTTPDGVMAMSSDPNEFTTISALRNRIKGRFDKFDVASNVQAYVSGLGQEINVLTNIKNKYQRGTITELLDVTQRENFGKDEIGILIKFEDAERKMLESMLANPYNVTSILTNSLNFDAAGEEYSFTWNADEAKRNPNLILLKNDPKSGNPIPELSDYQREAAFTYLRTQARLMYDKTEKTSVIGASERPRLSEWEAKSAQEKTDRRNLLDQWMRIRTAPTAQEKDAAAENLLGALRNYQKGVIAVDPTNTGVIIKYADGKEIPVEYKANGADKSGEAWAAAGTFLHEIEDQKEYNKYKGTSFADLSDWGQVGASYSMPVDTESGVKSKELWSNSLNAKKDLMQGYILSSSEEGAVTEMSKILENSGFSVDESGFGNNITITAPDGVSKIEIGTNEGSVAKRASDAAKLMNFLKNNMTDEKAQEWASSGVGAKW